MELKQPQAGSSVIAIEKNPISLSAGIDLMKHLGVGDCGNFPSFLAKPQTEFCILPVEKKTFVQQAGIFDGSPAYEHASAIQGMKPVVGPRLGT